jgi:hypothetical protein
MNMIKEHFLSLFKIITQNLIKLLNKSFNIIMITFIIWWEILIIREPKESKEDKYFSSNNNKIIYNKTKKIFNIPILEKYLAKTLYLKESLMTEKIKAKVEKEPLSIITLAHLLVLLIWCEFFILIKKKKR